MDKLLLTFRVPILSQLSFFFFIDKYLKLVNGEIV